MAAHTSDLMLQLQAGIIDPKNKKYIENKEESVLKKNLKRDFEIIDRQDAINRFKWYNLPSGLTGQLIERILYFKGQGAFFYIPTDDNFYFLPYALSGTVDMYGRFTKITPLIFAGGNKTDDKPWIDGLIRKPVYSIKLDEMDEQFFTESCVLLKDYSPAICETITPRCVLNDPILDVMADCIPFMRTSLISGTGIKGMRVDDSDQYKMVQDASKNIASAALKSEMYVPIISNLEIQELTNGPISKSEEYMLSLQSLDNFRLSTYGLENGGLFQKKQQMLQAEQAMNGGNVGLVMQDSLTIRQEFCDIVNSIWGLGISVEPSENITPGDQNYDGYYYDTSDNNIQDNDLGGQDDDSAI